jgi:uncharacterized delta-60 repeat protein
VVSGYASLTFRNDDFALARYNSDGSLDTTFGGGDGKVTTAFTSGNEVGLSVAVQTDGKIVVSGASQNNFALARYNTDGSLDTSFTVGTLVEDSGPSTLIAVGSFGFDDADLIDTHTVGAVAVAGNALGGNLTASIGTAATGSATGSIDWNYTVANSAAQQLAQGQRVAESFIVTVDDGQGGTTSQTIEVAVIGVNDAPTLAAALSDQNALQGQPFTFTLPPGTFADVDATDILVYMAARADGSPLPAWLTFNAITQTFSGTPANGDAGFVDVRVTATDPSNVSISDVVRITVANTNGAPAATGDTAVTLRNTAVTVPVRTNDSDPDGDPLTVSAVTQGANGTVVIDAATGNPRYTPAANFAGLDSFTYTVSDGRGGTSTATVNVTVATLLGDNNPNTLNGTNGADVIVGLGGADTIGAASGNDYVDAGDGNDIITGGAGADTLKGGAGADTFRVAGNELTGDVIDGGADADTLQFSGNVTLGGAFTIANVETLDMGGFALAVQTTAAVNLSDLDLLNSGAINGDGAANTITGTKGADTINGGAGNDVLAGFTGNDTLNGGAGNDTVDGGDGNDLIVGGAGPDSLQGGAGADTFRVTGTELTGDVIDGGADNDTLQFAGNVTLGSALALANVETLNMGGFALNVQTTAAVNLSSLELLNGGAINGNAVDNNITGTTGGDNVNGGAGNDVLAGFSGNDTLNGDVGNDTLDGGDGDDILVGGAGADNLQGGTGADTFRVAGTDLSGDVIDGGTGDDTLQLTGNASLGSALSLANIETLNMGGFALNVQTTSALNLSTLSLLNGGAINGDATANNITGTTGGDNINGGAGNDVLAGFTGNDTLNGGVGNDTVDGGDGNDIILGGAGTDALLGGAGADTFRVSGTDLTGDAIDGGADADTLQFTGNVTLASALSLSSVETLDMGGFALTVQTTAAIDLSGLSLLNGGGITGDGTANQITGTQGNDNINGGGGSDVVRGGLGNDTLFGGAGADTIVGGLGNDLLFGGSGNAGDGAADTFVFNSPLDAATNVDTITGFEATARDKIALDPTLFAAVALNGMAGLDGGEFRASAGGNAADVDDFILFDSLTGSLYYDPDGSGAAAKALFAALTGVTGILDSTDFTTTLPPGA